MSKTNREYQQRLDYITYDELSNFYYENYQPTEEDIEAYFEYMNNYQPQVEEDLL